jgi:D-serine deaminase-like pyridoxal phosphate-dependent protein
VSARYDAATAHLHPPFAVVDLDAFDANAADLVRRAGGLPIRVASKSIRCRELIGRVLARPGFAGVMAYSLAEALWLAGEGVTGDVLVGYPTVDREALQKLATDDTSRTAVTIMVDSVEHLDFTDTALGPGHPPIRVCVELDVSWRPFGGRVHIGTRRSPVFEPAQALELAEAVVARDGFELVGLMAYEGHIAGVGDAPTGHPVRAAALRWMQSHSAGELARRRAAAVAAVRTVADLEFVNGGGTGSLERTAVEGVCTEAAAGSGLYGPALFDHYSSFQPRPAALFAAPVVRRPAGGIVTVFSAGYVASGPVGAERLPVPHLPPGLRLLRVEGAGEVQTPVTGVAADRLRIGDRVWFRHAKAGELCERFDRLYLMTGDRVAAVVPTYRGEGHNFG